MEEAESNQESHKSTPPKVESTPWLVFIPNHAYNKKSNAVSSQTFYNISERKSYIKELGFMRGNNCWSASHGWIFMQEPKYKKCCLWNPTSSVRINIPPYKWNFSSRAKFVISPSPLESTSCILMCLDNGGGTLFVYYFESSKWLRHDIEGRPLTDLFVLNGEFYCNICFFEVAVVDLVPSIEVRVLPDEIPCLHEPVGAACRSLPFFLESGGESYTVEVYFRIPGYRRAIHIVAFRKDYSNGTWNHVEHIGNRAFFLGPGWFAASWSADGLHIKKNSIYFYDDDDDERCVHIFDMKEGTVQVDAPCPEFLYSTSSTTAFWIMPSQ